MWLAVDLTSFWFRLATFVVVSSVGFLILLEELFISRFGAVVGMVTFDVAVPTLDLSQGGERCWSITVVGLSTIRFRLGALGNIPTVAELDTLVGS